MGFRSGFVISSVSFLFGTIFIASVYDFPLLYGNGVEASASEAAERFYLSMYNGPTAVTALLHGMMALGLIGLISKLHKWTEMVKYFDGGSLFLFMGAICMYLGVSVPNLRLIADPTNETLLLRSALMTQRQSQQDAFEKGESTFQPPTGPMTSEEKVSAIRIISACNTICALLLVGVVILQVTEWYMERQEINAQDQRRKRQVAELASVKSPASPSTEKLDSKKDQ